MLFVRTNIKGVFYAHLSMSEKWVFFQIGKYDT